MAEKHWYLVSYDVREPKRLRRVGHLVAGYGERIQYSVFRCRLTQRAIQQLRWELAREMEAEDDLLVIGLCSRCAEAIESRSGMGWDDDDDGFEIV